MSSDVVLESYVFLFRGAVCTDFISKDYNAKQNISHLVDDFLEYIRRNDCPALTPEPYVIEYIGMLNSGQL